jgi:hypothetical protein
MQRLAIRRAGCMLDVIAGQVGVSATAGAAGWVDFTAVDQTDPSNSAVVRPVPPRPVPP